MKEDTYVRVKVKEETYYVATFVDYTSLDTFSLEIRKEASGRSFLLWHKTYPKDTSKVEAVLSIMQNQKT